MKGYRTALVSLAAFLILAASLTIKQSRFSFTQAINNPGNPDAESYSGSVSCRQCHEKFHDLWSGSRHALAMQPYTQEFADRNLSPQSEGIRIGEAIYQAETGPGEGWIRETVSSGARLYPIHHVMGGKNVCYFLTPLVRGRLQTLPVAYDLNKKQWYDTTASGVRHFPSGRKDEAIQWTDPLYTFNTSCYHCHVSQLSANYDIKTDTYQTQWTEPGINCEACHGPGKKHIDVCLAAGKNNPPADIEIISLNSFSINQINSLCNVCHAKLSPIRTGFTPGDQYFDYYDLTAFESPDFYPDGRDLGENYTMTLWRMSPCVKSGKLDCMHCHTSSGRYRFNERTAANQACLPCQQKEVDTIALHSRHRQTEHTPLCISCHMPMTEFAGMKRTDHSMRPPVPAATLRYKSPNACNLCHTDKDAAWAQEMVEKTEKASKQKPYLRLAVFVDEARRREWRNLDSILSYIKKKDRDEVTTVSLIRLMKSCDNEKKWPALIQILKNDPSPMVRAAAAEGLKGRTTTEALTALFKAAGDEFRLVRVRTAYALASIDPRQMQVSVDGSVLTNALQRDFDRATDELIQSFNTRPDHYASHYNLGNVQMERGNIEGALSAFQNAIRFRPDFVPARVNIAFAYHAAGRMEEAEKSFREALKRESGNAMIWKNLALLLGEEGRLTEAEAAFRKVFKLDPDSAVAAYNLSVILAEKKPEESLGFAEKAHGLRPDDHRYAYTFAFYLNRSGETNRAIRILKQMTDRQAPYADAYTLLGHIYERNGKWEEAIETYMKAAENMNLPEPMRRGFTEIAGRLRSHSRQPDS